MPEELPPKLIWQARDGCHLAPPVTNQEGQAYVGTTGLIRIRLRLEDESVLGIQIPQNVLDGLAQLLYGLATTKPK